MLCFSGSRSYSFTVITFFVFSIGFGGFTPGICTNSERCCPSLFDFSWSIVAAESYRMTGSAIFRGASFGKSFDLSNSRVRLFLVCSDTTPIILP